MKIIEKFVVSDVPPNNNNVIWISPSGLKYNVNGVWTAIK